MKNELKITFCMAVLVTVFCFWGVNTVNAEHLIINEVLIGSEGDAKRELTVTQKQLTSNLNLK